MAARIAELNEEQDELVEELLGVDFRTEIARYWDAGVDLEERMLAFLPVEKRDAVRAVRQRYAALEAAIMSRTQGVLLEADQRELAELRRSERAELAGVLSPAELKEYDLRGSPESSELRSRLAGFGASEQEFRRIFDLEQTYRQTMAAAVAANEPLSAEAYALAETQGRAALNEELVKALGPERGSEYLRFQDADYRQLYQLAERMQVPPSVAQTVYEMRQTAERQKLLVEQNGNLTDEQRQRALLALAWETQRSVSEALGADLFKEYRASGSGWLDGLAVSAVEGAATPVRSLQLPPLPPVSPIR